MANVPEILIEEISLQQGGGRFFNASGKAIHAIVREKLRALKGQIPEIKGLEDVLPPTNKKPDILLDGDYILDITTTKSSAISELKNGVERAEQKYGEKAIDIVYDRFEGSDIANILTKPHP